MSKVRIYGDVSGYVDIAVPDNAGTTTLNLDKIPQADINGNIAMDTNTLYVDAANNRVGVGTASPNTALDIVSPSGAEAINIRGRSADDIGQLKFYENDGTTSLARLDSRTTHFEVGSYNELRFSAGGVGNSHVVIDTSGNLLLGKNTIGTSTVGVELNTDGTLVGTRSGGNPLFLNRTTSDGKIITLRKDGNEIGYLGSNTTAGQSLLDISSENDSSSNIRFLTYGSGSHNEVMRLASNKMVGIGITAPTASWGNGTGVQFNPAGEVLASKVNGTSLYLNRTSSSGSNRAVISINENSSNIGTIGMGSGSELAISTNAGTQYISQKINNDTDGIQYSNVGTYHFGPWLSKNDTVDLGRSNGGWRDLYLTGGIQFDARSNKLDDYEEGTWMPTVGIGSTATNSFTGGSYITQNGKYTKVGNMVTLWFHIRISNKGSQSGSVYMKGLPFTNNSDDSSSEGSTVNINYWNSMGNPVNLTGYVQSGRAQIILVDGDATTVTPAITNTDLTNSSSWYGAVTYRVT
jgi:hypothetical protein